MISCDTPWLRCAPGYCGIREYRRKREKDLDLSTTSLYTKERISNKIKAGKEIDVKIKSRQSLTIWIHRSGIKGDQKTMDQKYRLMDISFSDEYAYKDGPACNKEQEIYTDNDIVWSEIAKHAIITEIGASRVDFAEGFNKLLPDKAEELGYKQAYLEAFLGMLECGVTHKEIARNLRLSEQQLHALMEAKTIKYRIFPTSTNETVNHTTAEYFKRGYNLAYEAIEKTLKPEKIYELATIRKSGIACARKEIYKFLEGELFEEYCVLYDGVI